jgi:uncharacterized protein (TIGR03066 family)
MFGLLVCFTVALAGCSSSSTTGGGGSSPSDKKGNTQGPGPSSGDKLVGKWNFSKEIPELKAKIDVTMELTADGKAYMSVNALGKEEKNEGTYKHDGDKLTITSKDKKSGKDDTETMTIKKLTDTELTVTDPKKGEDMTFTRKK